MMRLACLAIFLGAFSTAAADFSAAAREADRLYLEGSYRLAHEAYGKINVESLSTEEKRWLQFRLAETLARSEASTKQGDDSGLRQAEAELKKLIGEGATQDRVWAEALETLGDVQRGARGAMDLGGAWTYYGQALDYWAGTTNLVLGADKYWSILRKAAEPAQAVPAWFYGSFGLHIPLPVLENALKIARNEDERARAHFMIAMTLRAQAGEWEQRFRIPEEFAAALKLKKDTRWYDDALFFYGDWMSNSGRAVQDEHGNWRAEPDFEQALELFRRLVSEFQKGETAWYDDARNRIQQITREDVDVSISNIFLPGSEVEFHLAARNVESVEFTLYAINLNEDISFRAENTEYDFNPDRARKIKSWKKALGTKLPHTPSSENLRLDEPLPKGAYMLVAKGGAASDRELLMVTDAALVIQTAGRQAVAYACDSASGAPLPGSEISLWERYYENSRWRWTRQVRQADAQGLAMFELKGAPGSATLFGSAKLGDRQAFSYAHGYSPSVVGETWKIFAFPDKPAYRPGETVQWKLMARRHRGEAYSVPAGQKLVLRLLDPRGAEIAKQAVTLNDFGSAWGQLALKSDLPLGEYQTVFLTSDERHEIGRARLFRLEEYKLPEFKVGVHTPEENGRKKTFLLGEAVEVEIAAEYYFGGPVANAGAEIVITQAPYYHIWTEPRDFQWYYQSPETSFRSRQPGQVIQRETVKTDAAGKAKITFRTPLGAGEDQEYRIEARVTDASRREIIGVDRVRVGRQRFYVYPRPAHKLFRPQDKVEVEFRTRDANEQPVAAEGTVQVSRDYWFEVWLAPDGREVKGPELKQLQSAAIFPPTPPPGQRPWRLKFRGYQQDQLLTRTLRSGTNGLASLTFTAEREGYYRVAWRTDEPVKPGRIPSRPIRAETTVWVATGQTADLGYRSGRFEILVDQESFRAGQKAAVMLSAPTNDRYVLLTTTGGTLLDYKLVHLDGSVKLIEIDVNEKHVPNFFLNGTMVSDQEVAIDQKEIVVPPSKNFLTVEVDSDRAEYRPGERGTLHVRTHDSEGKPVSAEIALSVFDESVSAIQEDYAGDPRQFFFGTKRPNIFNGSSSFNFRPYRKVAGKDEPAMDSAEPDQEVELRRGNAPAFDMKRKEMSASHSLELRDGAALGRMAEMPVLAKAMAGAPASPLAPGAEDAVQVRSDFRSSVFWEPALRTDANGRAEVTFPYPDTLTAWKAVARVVTKENQFGIDDARTRTRQPLSVRLQAPRFFLAGDAVTVSAIINNHSGERLVVSPSMEAKGVSVSRTNSTVDLGAGEEGRVDWVLRPQTAGEVALKVQVRGGRFSDAMEKTFPVYEHGIEKFLAVSGKSRGSEARATLTLPAERKTGSTRFTVQVTPSLAVTMLDALPYLIDYPYGCTEQTMSRFLPATITAKTLKDLGLNPEDVMGRAFGGIEPATGAKTHPAGQKNLDELGSITAKGLERLREFQHSDGGWGWWKEGESDRFMTAYVLWGLALAKSAGTEVDGNLTARAAEFLNTQLIEAEHDFDQQAFILHALAARAALENRPSLSAEQQTAFDNLWENRDRLNSYTRALFALAAHAFQKTDAARTLARNLANGVKREDAPGQSALVPGSPATRGALTTAHWGEDGLRWHWSEGGVEATAFALRALLAIDPANELVEPAAHWLIKNRRGAQWSNTRDTAMVLLALNDYLRASGELKAELEYEVFVNGQSLGGEKIRGAEIFRAPRKFTALESQLKNGVNEIRIERKSGDAPIYFSTECTFFSLEEPIKPAGNEIFVERRYYKVTPVATLLKGVTYTRTELAPGDSIASGERIETVLTIEAKNNYEYLLFEDLKASGVEAVEIRSGESLQARRIRSASVASRAVSKVSSGPQPPDDRSRPESGATRWVYQELRDRKVALFIDKLPEGFWEIRYEGRAEIPGEFHALPVVGHAMYVPEIRANSTETKVVIYDKDQGKP